MTRSSNGPLRVGIGGPVGSGKTALVEALCKRLRDTSDLCAITNDIYTKEDARLLTVAGALPEERIMGVESGGDNLAATFSPELADLTVYVIDVAGGEKIPRKGGPGITRSDLLVINKIDLAPHVGADLAVMDHDARLMRRAKPFVFANVRAGEGVAAVADFIETAGGLRA